MPFIAREDGEHFVIPSYRDVLTSRQKSALKETILTLSKSYGEYAVLRQKGANQYEAAFSTETGYLLGESIWHQFNRPLDMIYCEAIPNTQEAILVIVKSGSVYLDGSFSLDSIPDELVIFLTQQNNFEIYTYGNVPIAEKPENGKFSFDTTSVKSYKVLGAPVFQTIPKLEIYRLQLVEVVLKQHGIGGFPFAALVGLIAFCGLGWMIWGYMTSAPPPDVQKAQMNPYQGYYDALTSPSPLDTLTALQMKINTLFTMPGWVLDSAKLTNGSLTIKVGSKGAEISTLKNWAEQNGMTLSLGNDGVYMNANMPLKNRAAPKNIYTLDDAITNMLDKIIQVYPGNHFALGAITNSGMYRAQEITLNLDPKAPAMLSILGRQINDLPLVLKSADIKVTNGLMSGTLIFVALGN